MHRSAKRSMNARGCETLYISYLARITSHLNVQRGRPLSHLLHIPFGNRFIMRCDYEFEMQLARNQLANCPVIFRSLNLT